VSRPPTAFSSGLRRVPGRAIADLSLTTENVSTVLTGACCRDTIGVSTLPSASTAINHSRPDAGSYRRKLGTPRRAPCRSRARRRQWRARVQHRGRAASGRATAPSMTTRSRARQARRVPSSPPARLFVSLAIIGGLGNAVAAGLFLIMLWTWQHGIFWNQAIPLAAIVLSAVLIATKTAVVVRTFMRQPFSLTGTG
jgi:hypothetical protein